MTKRQALLQLIKIAGYHNDTKTGTRLFVENRITRADYDAAFHAGIAAKAAGQICTCSQCKGGLIMQTKLAKLEKRLEKMRNQHYLNTKRQDYCQADDRRDWRAREPLLNEIKALKKELGL